MGHKVKVVVQSSLPPASAEWEVDNGDDMEGALIYTNLAYDLIAAAMMKLGVEFSKYMLEQDKVKAKEALTCEVKALQEALRAGTVAG